MGSIRSTLEQRETPTRSKRNSKVAATKVTNGDHAENEFDQPASDLPDLRIGLLYWFYERHDSARTRLYADLIESLLREIPRGSILEEECRSLIAESRGDLPKAIRHRRREIERIRRLHQISRGTPNDSTIRKLFGDDDLSDRLDILATLYHEAGKTKRALVTLGQSRAFCEERGIRFDGEDLFAEYSAELERIARQKRTASEMKKGGNEE